MIEVFLLHSRPTDDCRALCCVRDGETMIEFLARCVGDRGMTAEPETVFEVME